MKIRAYEDVASKFWEHFLYIANAINHLGEDGTGMWNEDGWIFLRRPAHVERNTHAFVHPFHGGNDSAFRGGNSGTGDYRSASRIQTPDGMVPREPERSDMKRGMHEVTGRL